MRYFMRKPAGEISGFTVRPSGQRSLALQEGLARYDPAGDPNQLLSSEELGVFVETFRRTGFTGGINWYRNFTRNWERAEGQPSRIDGVPCLMIMAEHDAVLPPSMADRMEDQISDLEKVLVEGSGHWTQQEKPERVNAILVEWLGRRFPNA
jgi:pimeloyl-ACP methyl ester carboxylesterase